MTTAEAQRTRDDRAAVDKAVSLLAAFGEDGSNGLGVTELARRADMTKSTAFRVLQILERNALVERIGTGYRLGARLHQLGTSVYVPGHEKLRDLLMPFLTELFQMTGHTVHLASLHGIQVFYLAKLYGHRTVATPSRIGGTLPANCTAVGKVLLAYDSDAQARILSAPLPGLTPHSLTDRSALEAELTRVRRDGIALERSESRLGMSCVAAPIFGRPATTPVAALSVSAPAGTDLRPLATAVRRVCASAASAVARSHVSSRA